jgi:UDP-3-O-[3-hydroxymyristoyl] glucosamine N-acyltransferase
MNTGRRVGNGVAVKVRVAVGVSLGRGVLVGNRVQVGQGVPVGVGLRVGVATVTLNTGCKVGGADTVAVRVAGVDAG